MKKVIRNFLKNKYFVATVMMNVLFFLSNFYLIMALFRLNNIENVLRLLTIIFLILILTLSILKTIKLYKSKNKVKSILLLIVLIILFLLESFIYNTIDKVYRSIDSISSDSIKYSSSLVVLKESNIKDINDIKKKKIGLYINKESVEGNIIPKEIIEERKLKNNNEIVEYEDISKLVSDLYSKKIDAVFLSSNYYVLFSYNGYSNIKEDTIVLASKDKFVKKKVSSKQEISEPFTILLMGVDSTNESIKDGSSINGDALLLITFNPKTLNATILSIPRDTYVPIACFKNKKENKITHAASYGQDCMIETIENFTEIDIDYYAKINFKGLVKLVDTLNGIYVDVPYSFCEQNSNRLWGKNTVFLEKGYRKINGEQALALSRNRHKPNDGSDSGKEMAIYCPTYNKDNRNDFVRGENQQKIISSIINQLKNIRNINDVYSLLDLISNSLETDLNINQILSLYNIGKELLLNNENATISFDSLVLKGIDKEIWDENYKQPLYNFYYNRDSLADIVKAMNINLENLKPEIIKEMNFSIKNPFLKTTIGSGPYNNTYDIDTLPNFVGGSIDNVNNWKKQKNKVVITKYVEVTNINLNNKVITQSIPATFLVKDIKNDLVIEVGKYTPNEIEEDLSVVPNFSNYTLNMANEWKEKIKSKINVVIVIIEKSDPIYDENKSNELYSQSVDPGIKIDEIDEITLKFFEN